MPGVSVTDTLGDALEIGPVEAFQAIVSARSGMQTMSSLYVTGIGVAAALRGAVETVELRYGVCGITVPFMISNGVAFYANAKSQNHLYGYLVQVNPRDNASSSLINAVKPVKIRNINYLYIIGRAVILFVGFWFADLGITNLAGQVSAATG